MARLVDVIDLPFSPIAACERLAPLRDRSQAGA